MAKESEGGKIESGKLMVFRSVRIKIFTSVILIALFFGVCMVLFAQTVIYDKLQEKLAEKGLALAKRVAEDCVSPVITERYFEMTMMFKDLQAAEQDIVYMYVESEEGRVLAHTFANAVPPELRKAHQFDAAQQYSTKDLSTDKGLVHDIAVPLMGGKLGALHMGLSDSAIEEDVNDIVMLIILFSALVLFAGTAASLVLSRTITSPLMKLAKAADAFGRGETDPRVSITSQDEIGNLARTFNDMIRNRKQAEEKILQSEQFIRGILDTVDEGFIVIDPDFRIVTANKAYCSQVGKASDLVIGRHCYETSHKTLRPCYEEGEDCAVRNVFKTGEPHAALHKHPVAKGSVLYLETKAFPIKDSGGAVTAVIETVTNITERHLLEEERLKTQKLEAIGTLAGGIAHDFNNLLQGIFGYISMAKITIADKDRSLAMLEQAEEALHMSVNLTTQLLTFSKGGKPVKKKTLLKPLIENSARFALSGSRVDYSIRYADDLWAVEADEGQLGQVIQNIVLNAGQTMPGGGTVLISARNLQGPEKKIPRLTQDKYVEISVLDHGIGIPGENLKKIFDPYFTTKEKGSGLGLATSYSIIRQHEGLIDVVSEAGKGATFLIYLPAVEAEREIKETPEVSSVFRNGKILVMDDEALVRNMAESLVTVLGHEIDVAENGESAVAKYQDARESGKPFDIVILDLTVRGGQGGKETIERLLAIDPCVRAVVSSGYSDDAVMADYEKYGFKARLNKPYGLEDLRRTINALLRDKE